MKETKPKRGIREVKEDIAQLTDWNRIVYSKRVIELIHKIRDENEPRIKELKEELAKLTSDVKPKKPRWPDNTPIDVVQKCKDYWSGTTEYYSFRIHCWNDQAIWTSYPSGGYSDNGGYHRTPPDYHMISRLHQDGTKPFKLKTLGFGLGEGKRVTEAMMMEELEKL